MRLPLIKHLVDFIESNDQDFILESIDTLESVTEAPGIKDEELDVIGELLSNMYGALEVEKEVRNGVSKKDALNGFMQRVMGSIDN